MRAGVGRHAPAADKLGVPQSPGAWTSRAGLEHSERKAQSGEWSPGRDGTTADRAGASGPVALIQSPATVRAGGQPPTVATVGLRRPQGAP